MDAIGNHRNEWKDFYSCYATVSGEDGSEKAVAGLIVDDSDIAFTVRYCSLLSGVDSTMEEIGMPFSYDHFAEEEVADPRSDGLVKARTGIDTTDKAAYENRYKAV